MNRVVVVLAVVALTGCAADPFVETTSFGDNPGDLRMFVDGDVDAPASIVVMLHGCTQDHTAARSSGLVTEARKRGALVVAAEQKATNNPQLCFNWFLDGDVVRGGGEVESVKEMIDDSRRKNHLQDAPAFVLGLSAGAVMAVSVAAAYPDVVDGVASFAGAPYGCATSVADASDCLLGNVDVDDETWAKRVRDHAGAPAGSTWPPLLVAQGRDDHVVNPKDAALLIRQWTALTGVDPTPTPVATEPAPGVHIDNFAGGLREILIDGLDHALPVDVAHGCGEDGPFLADDGFCSVGAALDFFDTP